jgi:hypothetical protein
VTVEKSSAATNQLPTVSIISPYDKKRYKKNDKVILSAEANDPDGIISKVEFKNGNTTIAEITTVPYTYTWEVSDTGYCQIIAIATDNLGATNSSSEITLYVEDFNISGAESVKLYPYPNDGHFWLDISSPNQAVNKQITIASISGKTIYTEIVKDRESVKEFYLSDIPAGTYVLVITDDKRITSANKFIKR